MCDQRSTTISNLVNTSRGRWFRGVSLYPFIFVLVTAFAVGDVARAQIGALLMHVTPLL